MASKEKLCPHCHTKNRPDALRCIHCGNPLEIMTTIAMTTKTDVEFSRPSDQSSMLQPGEIMFFVAGHEQPVVMNVPHGSTKIPLGRQPADETTPRVDLSKYNAVAGGVSRQHAVIHFVRNGVMIEDLNSTNGTWLNENRLTPHQAYALHSGDLIRLGYLLVFIYFPPKAENTLIIIEKYYTDQTLTPVRLMTHYDKFLCIIAKLQELLNNAFDEEMPNITVKAVDVHEEKSQIKYRVTGIAEAVELVQKVIIPWRKQQRSALLQMWRQGKSSAESALQAELEATQTQALEQAIIKLAPNLSGSQRNALIEKLLPHTCALALHTLELGIESTQ